MSKIYVAANANKILVDYLAGLPGCPQVISVQPGGIACHAGQSCKQADRAADAPAACPVGPHISMHPDIYMCKLGVVRTAPVFKGDVRELGAKYPRDVRFCAAGIGGHLVCNTRHTSPALLQAAAEAGLTALHVSQGYAKCNLATVTESAAVTSDAGIYKALRQRAPEIDVLLIRPGHIALPGFSYGFIGGASGRVGDEMIFCGNVAAHPDFESIREFVESRGLGLRCFPEFELTDIGSIIELE